MLNYNQRMCACLFASTTTDTNIHYVYIYYFSKMYLSESNKLMFDMRHFEDYFTVIIILRFV